MTAPGAASRRQALLGLALALAGCATRPPPPPPAAAGGPTTLVHVVGRGWHTDIALPAAGLHPALAGLAEGFPGARHLVFGFGDRAFLLGREETPLAMLRALLPGRGAILLTALATAPEAAFGPEDVVPLPLSAPEFARLQAFIAGSLDRGGTEAGGRLRPFAEGPYPGSVFLASGMTYAATYTCNTWTAEALAMAGLPLRVPGVVLARQVMLRARAVAAQRQAGVAVPASPAPVRS